MNRTQVAAARECPTAAPTMVMSSMLRWAALVLALTAFVGCAPMTMEGKRKVLEFRISQRGTFLGESPANPIAEGSRVTFDVRKTFPPSSASSGAPSMVVATSVLSADTTPRGVLDIVEIFDNRVTILATRAGATELLVMSDQGADTLTVNVEPAKSATVGHWSRGALGLALIPSHRANSGPPAASFLTGGKGRFVVHAYGEGGRSLTGFGAEPPITVAPPTHASLLDPLPGELQFVEVLFHEQGTVTISPRAGDGVDVRVDDPASISALRITTGSPGLKVDVEEAFAVYGVFEAEDRQERLLLGDRVALESATPDVCHVDESRGRELIGDGLFVVKGIAHGTCRLVARLGDLASERELAVSPKRA